MEIEITIKINGEPTTVTISPPQAEPALPENSMTFTGPAAESPEE